MRFLRVMCNFYLNQCFTWVEIQAKFPLLPSTFSQLRCFTPQFSIPLQSLKSSLVLNDMEQSRPILQPNCKMCGSLDVFKKKHHSCGAFIIVQLLSTLGQHPLIHYVFVVLDKNLSPLFIACLFVQSVDNFELHS